MIDLIKEILYEIEFVLFAFGIVFMVGPIPMLLIMGDPFSMWLIQVGGIFFISSLVLLFIDGIFIKREPYPSSKECILRD